jgi:hypothetical protein
MAVVLIISLEVSPVLATEGTVEGAEVVLAQMVAVVTAAQPQRVVLGAMEPTLHPIQELAAGAGALVALVLV